MSMASPMIPGRPPRHRWTGREFDLAWETGVFGNEKLELINGEVLEVPPMNDPHAQGIQLTNYALLWAFPPTWATIRIQCPMRLGESRPLPDLAVIEGTPRQVVRHPTTALLVIEISDTTLDYDENDKAELYASHGLQEYWIIDLNSRRVQVRRKPIINAASGARYDDVQFFSAGQSVTALAAPGAVIAVADLLP